MTSLGVKRRPGLGGGLGGGLGNPGFGAFSSPLGDTTPGGAASALLLEDASGTLLESGDDILLEA